MKQEADKLWKRAFNLQREGHLKQAIELYRASLKLYPTAEAHTYLGWALYKQGQLDQAIAECLQAIRLDPEFGNPYNDIGCYLMDKGRDDEALTWLERAKGARRYEPRHYPYLNLGRLYRKRGQLQAALRELNQAVELCPDDPQIRRARNSLLQFFN